jgi:ubiquinone/menaquinone biosynthesis C-methylase UbiE
MVTTICFLDDIQKAFQEAYRILEKRGTIIIGFIDQNSPVGKLYQSHKDENVFYKYANFYTVEEVKEYLKASGFKNQKIVQTIFNPLETINTLEPIKKGFGEGSFVVIRAIK